MSDRAKVQAMRDANWTPAGTYWRQRAEAAEAQRDMVECQAFSVGYEAGRRDALARSEHLIRDLCELVAAFALLILLLSGVGF